MSSCGTQIQVGGKCCGKRTRRKNQKLKGGKGQRGKYQRGKYQRGGETPEDRIRQSIADKRKIEELASVERSLSASDTVVPVAKDTVGQVAKSSKSDLIRANREIDRLNQVIKDKTAYWSEAIGVKHKELMASEGKVSTLHNQLEAVEKIIAELRQQGGGKHHKKGKKTKKAKKAKKSKKIKAGYRQGNPYPDLY